ncbi:GGDEF domain-containing response regulator [Vibrio marisflavi]|uniref:diguanylate cyclase n=1 Tax=Vibrio marisflavi CECT 7928 TaxID=634439 RepID=A0ABN8E462_9VIBR|nr:diguanylate cyclase [Vibrio marisflavi]CAH0536772.1 Sensor histidine kinase RcsC [Vibrio marisflavi CECT 7928]
MINTGSSMRILLVDDVQLDRMQLAIRLKQLGHIVETAASGIEALQIYPEFEPELVLLDVSMPEMDGFEVSQSIREKFPDWIPIIFLSGHEEPHMIAKAIEAGGDDYLTKPVDKLVLNSKLVAMQRIAFMRRELKRTSAKLSELNIALQRQVNEDGLTKLFNRRFIDNSLQDLVALHGRNGSPLSLILLDVDNFKPFNDNYGHIEGDRCLIELAKMTNELFTRSGDYVGRYGGEEFVVLLSNTSEEKALEHANRIKEGLAKLSYPHEFNNSAGFVTVSQGVLSLIPTGKENIDDLYRMADRALYRAKNEGRNCFVLAEFELYPENVEESSVR